MTSRGRNPGLWLAGLSPVQVQRSLHCLLKWIPALPAWTWTLPLSTGTLLVGPETPPQWNLICGSIEEPRPRLETRFLPVTSSPLWVLWCVTAFHLASQTGQTADQRAACVSEKQGIQIQTQTLLKLEKWSNEVTDHHNEVAAVALMQTTLDLLRNLIVLAPFPVLDFLKHHFLTGSCLFLLHGHVTIITIVVTDYWAEWDVADVRKVEEGAV